MCVNEGYLTSSLNPIKTQVYIIGILQQLSKLESFNLFNSLMLTLIAI